MSLVERSVERSVEPSKGLIVSFTISGAHAPWHSSELHGAKMKVVGHQKLGRTPKPRFVVLCCHNLILSSTEYVKATISVRCSRNKRVSRKFSRTNSLAFWPISVHFSLLWSR